MDQEHPTQYNNNNQNLSNENKQIESQCRQQDTIKQQNSHHQYKSINNNSQDIPQQPYVPHQGNIPMKVRNRRFQKLLQLRFNNFFDQQAIKLRHPLIYYLFVGQYQFESSNQQMNQYTNLNSNNLLSSFLSNHLINIEYKHLLSQQMTSQLQKMLQIQKNNTEEQILQIKRIFSNKKHIHNFNSNHLVDNNSSISLNESPFLNQSSFLKQSPFLKQSSSSRQQDHMQIENGKLDQRRQLSDKMKNHSPSEEQISSTIRQSQYSSKCNRIEQQNGSLSDPQLVTSMYQKLTSERKLTEQDKQIQEQHLIEYCEELFLEGKLQHVQQINYHQIDNTNKYDDLKQENKDLEEKYFDEIQEEMEQNAQNYYTGIQDY